MGDVLPAFTHVVSKSVLHCNKTDRIFALLFFISMELSFQEDHSELSALNMDGGLGLDA